MNCDRVCNTKFGIGSHSPGNVTQRAFGSRQLENSVSKRKNKAKEKKKHHQKMKYEQQKQSIESFRRMAPKVKSALRTIGVDLPFYDYLDNYQSEFSRFADEAKMEMKTLVGVHELDIGEFRNPDWGKFGLDKEQQITFSLDDRFSEYGKKFSGNGKLTKTSVRFEGDTTYFLDGGGGFHSIVKLPRNPKGSLTHSDLKYAVKIGILLHEIGHVYDAENRINIDPISRRFDVVEGEAFAHCYALDHLAEQYLVGSYNMLYDSMEAMAVSGGYEGEIGELVCESHPRKTLVNWQDYWNDIHKLLKTHNYPETRTPQPHKVPTPVPHDGTPVGRPLT